MPNYGPEEHKVAAILIACAALAVSSAGAAAANWPQFRGPNSSGVVGEAKPPVNISPTNGVLWKIEVPWSPSSPCVWGDRIFLTTFDEFGASDRDFARGMDLNHDGKITKADFGERIFATPALVGDKLYLRTQTHLYAFGGETH